MRRWLVTGAGGQLGGYLLREIARTDPEAVVLAGTNTRSDLSEDVAATPLDLADHARLADVVADWRPTHVIHAGAVTAVGDAYRDPVQAQRVNADGTQVLAEQAQACGAHLLYVSTDMVFDGDHAPYDESARPEPLSAYGRSKLAGEAALVDFERVLTVRVPLMYGFPLTERPSTFANQITALREGRGLKLFTDEYRTPLWLGDAARGLVGLSLREACGLLHLPGPERLSRYDLIERAAHVLGLDLAGVEQISRLSIESAEPRPEDLSLASRRLAAEYGELAPAVMSRDQLQVQQ